jgi:hypothetical protein
MITRHLAQLFVWEMSPLFICLNTASMVPVAALQSVCRTHTRIILDMMKERYRRAIYRMSILGRSGSMCMA